MPYIIDGHNLIPHISGLSLDQLDDEMALMELLANFFKNERKKAEVYFDKAAPGHDHELKHGFVSAHFTRLPLNADKAIRNAVNKLGKSAANYTIVSSDHEVLDNAQRKGARVLTSAKFAQKLNTGKKTKKRDGDEPADDINYWFQVFGGKS